MVDDFDLNLVFKELYESLTGVSRPTKTEKGVLATVVRTDEQGTTWVDIPGGDEELPVTRMLQSVNPGDVIFCKFEDGQLIGQGSTTNPGASASELGQVVDKTVVIENVVEKEVARVDTLEADTAVISGKLTAAEAEIGSLQADHVSTTDLEAATARIGDLEADHVSTTDFDAATGRIGTLEANTADIATIRANSAKVANLTAQQLEADHATVGSLSTTYATISNLDAATARIGDLEADHVSTTDFDAATARIGDLEADHVSTTDFDAATGRIGTLEADHVSTTDFDAATGRIGTLEANTADIATIRANSAKVANLTAQQLEADHATVGSLSTTYATISNLDAATARIGDLEADHVSTTDFDAATGRIGDLEADHVSTTDFDAATGRIGTLEANTADISTIRANSAKVANLTAAQLEADHATVGNLNANYAHISNGVIDNAKIGHADVNGLNANYAHISNGVIDNAKIGHADVNGLNANYARVDMANVNNAWITQGVIKDGAISSAMINDVSANKLTAGTINGSVINVTNLNADNITAGTINGQRIGEGSLSLDKLSEDVYTEAEIDGKLATMQAQIDGAIETWTGTAVPTLNNAPASGWTTTALKDSHVGDVYFVVNSQSQQNGYNYRFTKSGSTYSWQLIKDNDVTNALQRISAAEGKITTFDTDISTLKTDTGSLTTRTNNLEGRMATAEGDISERVTTTTFNELSDTVDGHTQTLSQHTTAIASKADGSTVATLTNRVSKTEQDISGINTTIGALQTTVASKADGSTLETVSNKLNTVSDTVDGHTQTISQHTSAIASKADGSTVTTLSNKVNTISDTVDGHTQTISSIQTAQSSMQTALATKVETSTFNTLKNTVTENSATISELTTSTETIRNDLDALEIGGRNLLRGTQTQDSNFGNERESVTETSDTWLGCTVFKSSAAWADIGFRFDVQIVARGLVKVGDVLTYSIWAKTDDTAARDIHGVWVQNKAGGYHISGSKIATLTDSWTRYEKQITVTAAMLDASTIGMRTRFECNTTCTNGKYIYWAAPKLEKGNKATDWTPAPEDVERSIATVSSTTNEVKQTANANLAKITQLVTTVGANADGTNPGSSNIISRTSAVEQDISGINTTIGQLQTTVGSKADGSTVQTLRDEYNQTKTTVAGTVTRLGQVESVANGVRSDFDNLQVGGRNLWITHRTPDSGTSSVNGLTFEWDKEESEFYVHGTNTKTDAAWGDFNGYLAPAVNYLKCEPGDTLTLSAIGDDIATQGLYVAINAYNTNGAQYAAIYTPSDKSTVTVSLPSYHDSTKAFATAFIGVFARAREVDAHFKVKLEKGTKATDWTPAPEDIEAEVSSVSTSLATYKQTVSENFAQISNTYATKTELGTETGNRQTAIQQLSNTISSKANASDVYTKTDVDGKITQEVNNRNSAIEQSANAINLSVSQNYTTKTEFNALEVGGRNLLLQSKSFGTAGKANRIVGRYYGDELVVGRNDGFNEIQANENFRGISVFVNSMGFAVGDKLVFSANIRSDSTVGTGVTFYCMAFNASGSRIQGSLLHLKSRGGEGTGSAIHVYGSYSFTAGSEDRAVVEITWLQAAQDLLDAGGNIRFTMQAISSDWSKGSVTMWAPKLEKGNKPTDWSPAPEDMATSEQFNATSEQCNAVSSSRRGINLYAVAHEQAGYLAGVGNTIADPSSTQLEVTSDWIYVVGASTVSIQTWLKESKSEYMWLAYTFFTDKQLSTNISRPAKTIFGTYLAYENIAVPEGAKYIRVSYRSYGVGRCKVELDGKTAWSESPVDSNLYEAKAEIKVTTDGISTEVAKKVGSSEIISKINQSAESVTIDASKINVNGVITAGSIAKTDQIPTDLSQLRRSCQVGQATGTVSNPWYKFASVTMGGLYTDYTIQFTVQAAGNYGDTKRDGVLRAHVRTNGAKVFEAGQLEWVRRSTGIVLSDFVLAYKNTANTKVDVELWCRVQIPWNGYQFFVDYEATRTEIRTAPLWEIYDAWSQTASSASITDGYTQIPSTDVNAAQATADAAVSAEQYIYIAKASGTTSVPKNETWVTDVTGGQGIWTAKRPQYSSDNPVLFVAKQSQTMAQKAAGTACTCTTPHIDDTTTVIDGGHITTGTIDTNRLNAATIKSNIVQTTDLDASRIKSGTIDTNLLDAATIKSNIVQTTELDASKIKSGDIAAARIKTNVIDAINSLTAGQIDAARIKASQLEIGQSQVTGLTSALNGKETAGAAATAVNNLRVGGRNLLKGTANITTDVEGGGVVEFGTDSMFGGVKTAKTQNSWTGIYMKLVNIADMLVTGEKYTASVYVKTDEDRDVPFSAYRFTHKSNVWDGDLGTHSLKAGVWEQLSITFTATEGSDSSKSTNIARIESSQAVPLWWAAPKLERGTKATDWTPAPEDVASYTDSKVAVAAKTATNYITADPTNGIKVHDASNTTDYVQIKSDGTHIYKGGTDVAMFGSTARVGKANDTHIEIDGDDISFYNGTTPSLRIKPLDSGSVGQDIGGKLSFGDTGGDASTSGYATIEGDCWSNSGVTETWMDVVAHDPQETKMSFSASTPSTGSTSPNSAGLDCEVHAVSTYGYDEDMSLATLSSQLGADLAYISLSQGTDIDGSCEVLNVQATNIQFHATSSIYLDAPSVTLPSSTVLAAEHIPNLAASKITSGTLSNARVSNTATTAIDSIFESQNTAGFTIKAAQLARWGRVVQLGIQLVILNAVSVPANGNTDDYTVGTLVSACRPKYATGAVGSSLYGTQLSIGTNGVIKILGFQSRGAAYTIAANTNIGNAFITYVLAS